MAPDKPRKSQKGQKTKRYKITANAVGDEICWRQVLDVGDTSGPFRDQHPTHQHNRHQHHNSVINI